MKQKKCAIYLIFLYILSSHSPVEAENLRFATIDYCPFTIDSLKNITIGIIKGYDYSGDKELNEYFNNNIQTGKVQVLHGIETTKRAIIKLLKKRIDVYLEGEYSVQYELNKMGVSNKVTIAGYTLEPYEDYTGFSQHHPRSAHFAKILSEGIAEMKKSGQFNQILMQYGLLPESAK